MNTMLTPAPELRTSVTAPSLDAVSPEVLDGRLSGKVEAAHQDIPVFEKPWHTHAAKCLALHMTQEETANFCGVTTESIKNVMRSPVFQLRLREELHRTSTPLIDLFNNAGVAAFSVIVDVMSNPKTSAAVKLASAKEVIDRCLGKAPQTIKHEDTDPIGDPVAMVEHLKQQNVELRKQLPN